MRRRRRRREVAGRNRSRARNPLAWLCQGRSPDREALGRLPSAGHLGFVYKGKTPDGAEYRYTKAKEALIELAG